MSGWALINTMNDTRRSWYDSYNAPPPGTSPSVPEKIGYFVGHKVVSVIDASICLTGIGIGITGMVLSVCTLGALKVAVFVVTLGNIRPEFPSGFEWFGRGAVSCVVSLAHNATEWIYDAIDGCVFVVKRLNYGFRQAALREQNFYGRDFSIETPPFLNWIDGRTSAHRIEGPLGTRPFSTIMKHYAYSLVNLPLNATVATVGFVVSAILGAAFVGKSLICAATNIDIPLPTAVLPVFAGTLGSTRVVIVDIANCVLDVAILGYKVIEATRLVRAAGTIRDLIMYIPQALFH